MPARALRRHAAAVAAALCLALASDGSASKASSALREAAILESEGRVQDAEASLRRLLDSEGARGRHPAVLLALARLTPSLDESIALAREVIENTRDAELLAGAHALRGDLLYALGSYAEAAVEYEAATAGGSADARRDAAFKRGTCLLAAGDATAAEKALRSAAADARDDDVPWIELGVARSMMAQGRHDAAAIEFERIAAAHPNHGARPGALSGAAEAHEAAGNLDGAVAALTTLLGEYPESYEATLGRERLRALAVADTAAAAPPDSSALPTP